MGLWLTLTIMLNALSAILLVAVFVLIKKHSALKQDLLRLQKEWMHWKAMGFSSSATIARASDGVSALPAVDAELETFMEPQVDVAQITKSRGVFADDWGRATASGGIREKSAKSLKSETVGESSDRFSKARELLRQGHGMKEVAVVTGLSYSELSLLSKTEI